jgi:flagellar assembly factor FliW
MPARRKDFAYKGSAWMNQGGYTVKVPTTRFGELEVAQEQVFELTSPLPGFAATKHFFFIQKEKIAPFEWMQSVEESELTFVVLEPGNFFHDYAPQIAAFELKELGIERPGDAMIKTIVVLPEDMSKMTANLRGPLVINIKDRKLKQVFIESDQWSVRESIIEAIKRKECAAIEKKQREEASSK